MAPTLKRKREVSFSAPQENVQVVVGKEKVVFNVWKSLLCAKSPYFDRALNGQFIEGCGTVVLEEEDPKIFGLVIEYIYKGRISEVNIDDDDMPPEQRAQEDVPTHNELVRLWILADYLCIPRLQNLAARKLCEKMLRLHNCLLAPDIIPLVYDKTAPGCPFRSIVIEEVYTFGEYTGDTWFSDHRHCFPEEFLFEFMLHRLLRSDKKSPASLAEPRKYYVPEQRDTQSDH